jgi:hypothetical protein
MAGKSTLEKLRVLLPHWLEHNQNHRLEFARWAETARAEGEHEIALLIERAVAAMQDTDSALEEAMTKMGVPPAGGHHHHHHQ